MAFPYGPQGRAGAPRTPPAHPQSAPKSPLRGILAGLIVIVAASVAIYFALGGKKEATTKAEGISHKKPTFTKQVIPAKGSVTTATNSTIHKKSNDLGYWNGHKVISKTERTNDNGTVVQKLITDDGKSHRISIPPRPIFTNSADQFIADIILAKDRPLAPIPVSDRLESDFAKALNNPIEVDPSDSDEIRELKANVTRVREIIKMEIDKGRKFSDILAEHNRLLADNAKLKNEILSEYNRYIDTGDAEGAKIYLDKMNEHVSKLGMDYIDPPLSRSQKEVLRKLRFDNK